MHDLVQIAHTPALTLMQQAALSPTSIEGTCARERAHARVHTCHMCARESTHAHSHASVHVRVGARTYAHARARVYAYVGVHVNMHTYNSLSARKRAHTIYNKWHGNNDIEHCIKRRAQFDSQIARAYILNSMLVNKHAHIKHARA